MRLCAVILFLLLPCLYAGAQKVVPAGKPVLLHLTPKEIKALPPQKIIPKNETVVEKYTNAFPVKHPPAIPLQASAPIAIGKPEEIQMDAKYFFGTPSASSLSGNWKYKPEFVYNISNMDVDQGMASPNVGNIISDRLGNIWVPSGGLGVNVFDGKYHYNFNEKTSPVRNYCGPVVEDKTGKMWIALAYGQLTMYTGSSFISYKVRQQFPRSSMAGIFKDRAGNIWLSFTGEESFFILYNGKQFLRYKVPSLGMGYGFEDSKNNFWLTAPSGMIRIRFAPDGSASLVQYTQPELFSKRSIRCFSEDSYGNIWIATSDGLLCYANGSIKVYGKEQGLPYSDLLSTFPASNGLWIGAGIGAIQFYGKNFYYYTAAEGGTDKGIGAFYEDNKGNIWCSASGEGLYRINSKPFVNLSQKQKITSSAIISILPESDSVLWLGSNDGRVFRISNEKQTVYTSKDGLPGGQPRGLYKDSKGRIWIGYWGGGVAMFDGKDFWTYNEKQGLPHPEIISINEDKAGNIWFGSNGGGVICYTGEKFLLYDKAGGFPATGSWKLSHDKEGNLWIGLIHGGIVRYDGKDFLQYSTRQGLTGDRVHSHIQDSKGNHWIGTLGKGVSYFDGKTFRNFTSDNGLCNDKIYGIKEDLKHRVWFITEKGLACGAWKEDQFHFQDFNRSDGVMGLDYWNDAIAMAPNGSLYFGSGRGLVFFDSKREPSVSSPCSVRIDEVQLANNKTQWNHPRFIPSGFDTLWIAGTDSFLLPGAILRDTLAETGVSYSGISPFFNLPENLVLSYEHNHLSFSFAGQDWGDEHKLKYTYKMEGLDASWSPVSSKSEADYRNLPHGKYTLLVKAVNRYGEESAPASFSFTILPPWWKTWWFYLLEGIFALIVVYSIVKVREKALKERNKKLEDTVSERTKELVKQKGMVEQRNKDITDSINYARRIQSAILVPLSTIRKQLPDSFILYKPKDIVSGDFYFYAESNDRIIIAAVDCTGHGVPGAFMSMIGNEVLDQLVVQQKITDTSRILTELHRNILLALNRDDTMPKSKDGMDAAILSIDKKNRKVQFSGAARPLYFFDKNGFNEVRSERWSIGGVKDVNESFMETTIAPEGPATFYIFSDGFADQFGGEEGKKLMTKNFKRLLESIQNIPVKEQGEALDEKIRQWQGGFDQVDDILVIGVRI